MVPSKTCRNDVYMVILVVEEIRVEYAIAYLRNKEIAPFLLMSNIASWKCRKGGCFYIPNDKAQASTQIPDWFTVVNDLIKMNIYKLFQEEQRDEMKERLIERKNN